jgi:polyisoprenoid-binding protein YceI
MFMKISALALAVVAASPALAAPESFTIDSRHTFPVFEVNHLGFSLQRGRFNQTAGKIVIDREAKTGSVDVTIQVASIDMGIEKWDEAMRGEDYFNVAQFPTIVFKSTKVSFDGAKVVAAEGDLTMMGVTKPVKVAFDGFACGTHPINKRALCGGNATIQVKRSEFGLVKGLPGIADDVKIAIPVEAFKDQ